MTTITVNEEALKAAMLVAQDVVFISASRIDKPSLPEIVQRIYRALDEAEERGEKRGFKNGCETTKETFAALDADPSFDELLAEYDRPKATPTWEDWPEETDDLQAITDDECHCTHCQVRRLEIEAMEDGDAKVNAWPEGQSFAQFFDK